MVKGDCSDATSFTPHARGSTAEGLRQDSRPRVYPACAGIDLAADVIVVGAAGLPRMRRDRPGLDGLGHRLVLFTPHARGSTFVGDEQMVGHRVYPACAGIDP